jgi:tRNA (guanine37-N1)-methyltransferase
MGWKVPEILIGGNTPEIEKWRFEQSLHSTEQKRPDLLKGES